MTPCKQCGTAVPEQARFCPHCGAPVEHSLELAPTEPSPLPEQPVQPPAPPPPLEFVQPALAGGMFLGVLSTLPFISAGNCICCLWVLLGGGVASFLLTKQRPAGITYGDGAFVGVLSGLFGSIIGTAIHIPMQMITIRLLGSQRDQLENMMRQFGVQEGPMRDWMMRFLSGEISAATVLITFFSYLLLWSLFAMIGGILTVAILNKRARTAKGV